MSLYYSKYLKYKQKYLQLINQTGGDKPIISRPNDINRFPSGSDMEKFLNPIYGLYMCESGYIDNNYWLHTHKLILTEQSSKIKKLSRSIPGSVQPTKIIMDYTPLDIGRYIALLYICKEKQNFFIKITKDNAYIFNGIDPRESITLNEYIKKVSIIKNTIMLNTNDIYDFYIVLYCLWWVLNNDEGISEYYKGIEDVFTIVNTHDKDPFQITKKEPTPNISFEKILINITQRNFNIYAQEFSQSVCEPKVRYPDCGEITARNLINLICFNNDNKFDINILRQLNAIPEVITYYTIFYNFDEQSATSTKQIYDDKLNSRDAWSKLIILYANTNLNFLSSCDEQYKYELNSGMSQDNTVSNFFQLIKNLLPGITNWDVIPDFTIKDNTIKGIGDINITDKFLVNYTIHCVKGHYFMELNQSKKIDLEIEQLSESEQYMINILLHEQRFLTESNYIWFKFSSDNLVYDYFYLLYGNNNLLVEALLKLSFTNLYNSDTRRRITIDTDSQITMDLLRTIEIDNKIDILYQYTYLCTNFNFLKIGLGQTLSKLKYKVHNINEIDLSPLEQLTSIGNDFLYQCDKLLKIDLSSLVNLESIGNNFAGACYELQTINLLGLQKLKNIGTHFLQGCYNLLTIDLSSLVNLKSIGDNCLYLCDGLQTIDLSSLVNLESIGTHFLQDCHKLQTINLLGLKKLKTIDSHFLQSCYKLQTIDLSSLVNLKSIGDNFLYGCTELQTIDLSSLVNLESIGNNFLEYSSKLQTINLLGLQALKTIGPNFLAGNDSCTIRCSKTMIEILRKSNNKIINYKLQTNKILIY